MSVLALILVIIGGGLALDAQPTKQKQQIKKIYKKPIHFKNGDGSNLEVESILRQMEHGQDIIKRCPKQACFSIQELK